MKVVRGDFNERCDSKIIAHVRDVYYLKHKKKLEEMVGDSHIGAKVGCLAVLMGSHTEKK